MYNNILTEKQSEFKNVVEGFVLLNKKLQASLHNIPEDEQWIYDIKQDMQCAVNDVISDSQIILNTVNGIIMTDDQLNNYIERVGKQIEILDVIIDRIENGLKGNRVYH